MKIIKWLSINNACYHSVRMLIGVYQAIYLLSTGVSLKQLALLQVVFSTIFLISNIPIGIMCDRYGRKLLVIIGVLFTIAFYILCFFSPDLFFLTIAHTLYALGLCCVSNGIFGWMYSSVDNKEEYTIFSHIGQKVASIGSIASGVLGSAILYYTASYYIGYYVSIFFMVIIVMIYAIIRDPQNLIEKNNNQKESCYLQCKTIFLLIKRVSGGIYFIIITCLFTFGMQIIFHFWQPIMTFGMNLDTISKQKVLILMYCHIGAFLSQFIFNHILPKLGIFTKRYMMSGVLCGMLSGLCCFILLFMIKDGDNIIFSIAIYSLIHGTTSFLTISTGGYYTFLLKEEHKSNVSGMSGGISFFTRIAAVFSLLLIAWLPSDLDVYYYLIIPAISFILCGLVTIKWFWFSKHEQIDSKILE